MKNLTQKQSTITLSVLFGILGTVLFWAIPSEAWFAGGEKAVEVGSVVTGTFFLLVTSFLVIAYKQLKNPALMALSFLAGITLIAAPNFMSRGEHFLVYFALMMIPTLMLLIGLEAVALSEKKWSNLHESLHSYLVKLFDVTFSSSVLGNAVGIIIAIAVMLLGLSGINSSLLNEFIWPIMFSIPIFLALGITYDFSKPITQQKSFLNLVKIFSYIGVTLIFVVAPLMLLYIFTLVPSSFQLILETGETAPVFGGIMVFMTALLFFGVEFMNTNKSKALKKWLPHIQTLMLLEGLVLNVVALDAIRIRIAQHGMTFPRLVATAGLVLLGLLFLAYLGNSIKNLHLKKDQKEYSNCYKKTNLAAALIALTFFVLTLAVNFEFQFAKSHYHRIAGQIVAGEEVELDKIFLMDSGEKIRKYLREEAKNADPKVLEQIKKVVEL